MGIIKNVFRVVMISIILVACKDDSKTTVSEDDVNTTISKKERDTIFKEAIVEPQKESTNQLRTELKAQGFEIFDYVDEKSQDTILMQKYFIAFLKRGPIKSQNEEEVALLQKEHMAHLTKMYELGYADISGPFGDNGDIRGVTIYNVPDIETADSLANADPMVKAGRLKIEIHPWWAAKGYPLR
ncbi:YciI family protein [Changchengzhania lutea]|uniref:YciI family protein n=1 Tax=Changchengzhania lutea TaxID=2049305 RepID=UPI00115EC721|nr:YciI family protein [Changchengzhania lutea]